MKIGIVGGGLTGLALSYYLSKYRHQISIFERDNQLGGLTTYHDYHLFYWDRFYHVILPSDVHLIHFLQEIGLGDKIRWQDTLTGFYVDQTLYSISNTVEFLKFPPLSLINKMRLAFTILYGSRINDWKELEKVTAKDWLLRISGKKTYQKIWKPLLLAKFGENYQRVSAVFIWTYIKRLFSARHSSAKKEQFGYVEGGYKTVLDHLDKKISEREGRILLNTTIKNVYPRQESGIFLKYNDKVEHFDKVVFTAPVNILESVTSDLLMEVKGKWKSVEYLGVICVILITRKPLIPYYIVNIADDRIPFTGIIGMSNVVNPRETQDFHITYLPKYVLSEDPLLKCSDDELIDLFLKGLSLMFTDFKKENIEAIHVNRAFKVQPLQILHYSEIAPEITTKHKDFFVLNTSQFLYDTLNNNSVIKHVEDFLSTFQSCFDESVFEEDIVMSEANDLKREIL
jgi:protoporphyrinogen oxidase